jgi:DNA polymerase V
MEIQYMPKRLTVQVLTPRAVWRRRVVPDLDGFGSPADDTGVRRLDPNDILIKHPQAMFLMRVAGDAMRAAGIDDGDVVVVDRAIMPAHGHVLIAVVEGEFVCRRLFKQGGDVRLQATDPAGADIVPCDGSGAASLGRRDQRHQVDAGLGEAMFALVEVSCERVVSRWPSRRHPVQQRWLRSRSN